ncbi:hypothetical protein M5K25_018275 [Dendrobium thyrsiflorum]|uniref:Hexosyltransferase n=1 Tax=Dendrobium thyrsiflorum TaxID=117978 RepID=A0ABD0UPR7_DENTH
MVPTKPTSDMTVGNMLIRLFLAPMLLFSMVFGDQIPVTDQRSNIASVSNKVDDEVFVQLENAAIEHSKAVDSAVLGKYNLWRREYDTEHTDTKVKFMRDQMIMARIYMVLAKSKSKLDIYKELLNQLKENQRVVGKANVDADLPIRAPETIQAMNQVLSKAKGEMYDCNTFIRKLRGMLQSTDEQTIPNAIHCLSMRLSINYYLLPPEQRKFPRSKNLENPSLYHYALFSDNVLAASVVVNSTLMNAKEPFGNLEHCHPDCYNPSIDRSEIKNAAVIHYNGNMKPWLELAMTKYRPYWTRYINYDHSYIQNCKLRT